jgi:hypothetical protein
VGKWKPKELTGVERLLPHGRVASLGGRGRAREQRSSGWRASGPKRSEALLRAVVRAAAVVEAEPTNRGSVPSVLGDLAGAGALC